ncbi:hypothetical protein ACFQX6_40585 [Streptosporangium lutulentum]
MAKLLSGLDRHMEQSYLFGEKHADGAADSLSADEIAALYLYTCESGFYRQINAILRHPDRTRIVPYLPYLRLLFSAVSRLPPARSRCGAGCRWTCARSTLSAEP